MDRLRYIPLGGLGEVGLNMWALEWDGKLLIIDSGLMFPHGDMLGVDFVIPDVSYCLQKHLQIVGLFLTHGHEDHIGALAFLLPRLKTPVYGTRLTLGLLRPKLKERRAKDADLREVRPGDRIQLGPFGVEAIPVCHSIPDAVSVAISTPVGKVIYTGDLKLDPNPLDGAPTDVARFQQLGDEGVLLMLGDSTNAEKRGRSGSERDLEAPFRAVLDQAKGRVVVATFASNIHRIQHLVRLAAEYKRKVAVVGRSLQQNFKTAQELGFLDIPPNLVVRLEQAEKLPPQEVFLLTAGSQGEPMSALARFASQSHPHVNVRSGDTVVISATPIPGNELLVNRTVNNLYRHGAEVHYSELGRVHVSGHAYREELLDLQRLIRPKFFIPVHGEYRQLLHHARLALEAGLPQSRILIVEDGQTVELDRESIRLGPRVETGRIYVDGIGIGDVGHVVLRDRKLLAHDGLMVVSVTVDRESGALRARPEVISRGLIDPQLSHEIIEDAATAAAQAVRRTSEREPELTVLRGAIHDAVLAVVHTRTKRRPMVIPLVTEI